MRGQKTYKKTIFLPQEWGEHQEETEAGEPTCGERRVGRGGRGGRDGGAVGLGARRGVDGERRRAGDGDAARHRRRRRVGRGRGGSGGRREGRRGGGGGGGGEGGVLAEPAEAGVRPRAGHRLVPELVEEAHSSLPAPDQTVGRCDWLCGGPAACASWTYARARCHVARREREEGGPAGWLPGAVEARAGADDDGVNLSGVENGGLGEDFYREAWPCGRERIQAR